MKIAFIKQIPSKEGISDYRPGLIILKNGIQVISMKVDNESDIDKILGLFNDMENEICEIRMMEEIL